jgi:hypothetical protein
MRKNITKPYKETIKTSYRPAIDKGMEEAKTCEINSDYDIPYVCGYPEDLDNNLVYWDRHMPKFMTYKGRRINLKIPLCTHERVEKNLESTCGLPYLKAHKIATDMEAKVIRKMGVDWKFYNDFCNKYIKTIGSERIKTVPKDLDLQPYIDEHDEKDIKKLRAAMED